MVNHPIEPQGYQAPCERGQDQRNSDLCAQWKAADSANDAAYYAKLQIWAAAFGMLGLLVTIYLTLKAVRTAQQSVAVAQDTARRQLRAYIIASAFRVENLKVGAVPRVTFRIRNAGQTPAYEVRAVFQLFFSAAGASHETKVRFSYLPEMSKGVLGAGGIIRFEVSFGERLDEARFKGICEGTEEVGIFGVFSYRDAFKRRRLGTFKRFLHHRLWNGKPSGRLAICTKGNSAN